MKKSWEMVVLAIIFTYFCVVFLDFVLLFDIFHLFIDSAFRLICSLALTIPANYRLSSQFLSASLKVGVRVWFKVSVRFGIINNTKNVRFDFSLSWFKGLCCVCLIWKILHYVILYCGRLLIVIFHIQKFSRYVRKLILLRYCCLKCNVSPTPFPTSGTIIKTFV
jgi:hypothetical protein